MFGSQSRLLLAKNAILREDLSTQEQLGLTSQVHLLPSYQVNLSVSVRNQAVRSNSIILLQSSQNSSSKLGVSEEERKGGKKEFNNCFFERREISGKWWVLHDTCIGLRWDRASVSQVLRYLQQDLQSEIVVKTVFDHWELIPPPLIPSPMDSNTSVMLNDLIGTVTGKISTVRNAQLSPCARSLDEPACLLLTIVKLFTTSLTLWWRAW